MIVSRSSARRTRQARRIRVRRSRSLLAWSVATFLVLGSATVVDLAAPSPALAAPAATAALPADVAAAVKSGHAATEAVALAAAEDSGSPVTVDSETSPTIDVVANPDGYLEATESVTPQRRWINGTWKDLDSTLSKGSDGLVRPALAMGDLKISGGGAAGSMIASYSSEGFSYEVKSPFALPEPTLLDDSAVFSDVIDGVDLVVRVASTKAGFTYDWVVKTAAAAEDPRVQKLNIGVEAPGVTAHPRADGAWYDDASGVHRFWSPAPVMWDASGDGTGDGAAPSESPSPSASAAKRSTSAKDAKSPEIAKAAGVATEADEAGSDPADSVAAVEAGPAAGQSAGVALSTSSDSVTLSPDPDLLTSPTVTLPIVIDPEVGYQNPSAALDGWLAVWNIYPSKSFWKTSHSLGAGYEGYEQYKIVRSYFRFRTALVSDKHIIAAHLHIKQIWDASCTAKETDVYRTHQATTKTTWSNQPGKLGLQDTMTATTGCDGGSGNVQADVTSAITNVANNHDDTATFMVRAANEDDKLAWKQFADAGASLTLAFVSKPTQPALAGMSVNAANSVHACSGHTSTSPAWLGTKDLTYLSAKLSSADGAQADLRGVFTLVNTGTSHTDTRDAMSIVASGGVAKTDKWTVGEEILYRFYVKNRATWTFHDVAGSIDSAASASCYFEVDTTKPLAPTITSVAGSGNIAFHLCTAEERDTGCAIQGTQTNVGNITAAPGSDATHPAADTVRFEYQWNGVANKLTPTAAGKSATMGLTAARLSNSLVIWAVDAAGHSSPTVDLWVDVNHLPADDEWNFETDASTGASGTGDGAQNTGTDTAKPLTLAGAAVTEHGRIGAHAECVQGWPGHQCNGISFSGTTGSRASSNDMVVSAAGDFTLSFWAHLNENSAGTVLAATSSTGDQFEVGFAPTQKAWVAGRRASGATAITGVSAANTAVVNGWSHVTVTYSNAAPARTVTIYVNGVQKATGTLATAATANNGWVLGCGQDTDATTGVRCTNVDLDDVQLYKSTFTSEMITDLVAPPDPTAPDNNRELVSSAAHWAMGADPDVNDASVVTGANGTHDSVFGADLTVSAGSDADLPTFGPADPGEVDANGYSVLSLDGAASQSVTVSHPLVDSTASFTIAARVQIADPTKPAVIAQQSGRGGVAWTLAYRAMGETDDELGGTTYNGQFVFQRRDTSTGTTLTEVRTDTHPILPEPIDIAGVFDANEKNDVDLHSRIEFYTHGSLATGYAPVDLPDAACGTATYTTAWQDDGGLSIGNGTFDGGTAPLTGMIDDVQVFAGPLTDTALGDYFDSLDPANRGDESQNQVPPEGSGA